MILLGRLDPVENPKLTNTALSRTLCAKFCRHQFCFAGLSLLFQHRPTFLLAF